MNISYDDVEKYIAVNFKNSIDEDTVICNFNKLNSYFKEYKINDYEIIVMNLANTNDIIKENIQKIYNNKTNNKFINMFINYYNDLKEIEEYNNNVLLEGDNLLYSKKLLSKDEEIELGKRILLNDKDAINEMILHNTRLAKKIAGYYVGNGLEYEDLIQEAMIGLTIAAERFDYRKGYKFSTYAIWWIRSIVGRAVSNTARLVRIPVYVNDNLVKYKKALTEYSHKLGRTPTNEEMSKLLNIGIESVENFNKLTDKPISLQSKVHNNDELVLMDTISDNNSFDETIERLLSSITMKDVIDKAGLSTREKDILLARFGFYNDRVYEYEEIGFYNDVSGDRARSILNRTLEKLKWYYELETSHDFSKNKPSKPVKELITNNFYPIEEKERKIKYHIKNERRLGLTLYEYLDDYSKNEIDEALQALDADTINFLKIRCGNDYVSPIFFDEWDKSKTYNFFIILNTIKKTIMNNKSRKIAKNIR